MIEQVTVAHSKPDQTLKSKKTGQSPGHSPGQSHGHSPGHSPRRRPGRPSLSNQPDIRLEVLRQCINDEAYLHAAIQRMALVLSKELMEFTKEGGRYGRKKRK